MLTVAELMTPCPVTVREDDPVRVAASLMAAGVTPIRHLPVLREGKLVGIVSHRDLVRAGEKAHTRVGEVMSTRLHAVSARTPLRRAIDRLVAHRIGALPVLDNEGNVVGIFSVTDALGFAGRLVAQIDALQAAGRRGSRPPPPETAQAMVGMVLSSLPRASPLAAGRGRRRSSFSRAAMR